MGRGRSIARTACWIVPFVVLAGCAPGGEAEKALARWFDAIHGPDYVQLARFDLGAPLERPSDDQPVPAAWTLWTAGVQGAIDRYEAQRDSGHFDVDERGYALVRATRVGRGTFWQVERAEGPADAPVLLLKLNFGYGEIPFGSLPPGTTVYLLGHPLGTVHPVVLGRGETRRLTLLEHAWLSARLGPAARAAPGDARLKVKRIGWADVPPETARVSWVF